MSIWRFCMHQNQQVILSLLFYQASHEGRIYSLPKLQKSRRVTVSRPVCLGLKKQEVNDSYPRHTTQSHVHFAKFVMQLQLGQSDRDVRREVFCQFFHFRQFLPILRYIRSVSASRSLCFRCFGRVTGFPVYLLSFLNLKSGSNDQLQVVLCNLLAFADYAR